MKLVCMHFKKKICIDFKSRIQSDVCILVLGAGGNTFNEIRRQRQSHALKTMRVNNFLSPTDVMPLTVRITKSGNISVTITGHSSPFISAFDQNVLDIKFISFRLIDNLTIIQY